MSHPSILNYVILGFAFGFLYLSYRGLTGLRQCLEVPRSQQSTTEHRLTLAHGLWALTALAGTVISLVSLSWFGFFSWIFICLGLCLLNIVWTLQLATWVTPNRLRTSILLLIVTANITSGIYLMITPINWP